MMSYVQALLQALRPAFSRQATFAWFVVAFAGFVTRYDVYGVSSIVRALGLAPSLYPCLLNLFHSSAWSLENLRIYWWQWLHKQPVIEYVADRIVLVGDHTKQPKEARKMPEVSTMHQDSETSSKPTFFRGHHWACLGLLGQAAHKRFALPMWAEIHPEASQDSRATRLVQVAGQISGHLKTPAFLVLDAFFAVGSVFRSAATFGDRLHILTRAKKNVVAFKPPPLPRKHQRGRHRTYGRKLKLMSLFDACSPAFLKTEAIVYQKKEIIRYLTLDLIWKPISGRLRFFLIETSRGRIILMTSDFNLDALTALQLYCRRISIETLFDSLKNLLGGLAYHFWSKYLEPVSRRPSRNSTLTSKSSRPEKTKNTLEAIEKFLSLQLIVLGTLQLLAANFGSEITQQANCWLRTPCGDIPSAFVTRTALANLIRTNIRILAKNWITQLIFAKQKAFLPSNNKIDKQNEAA